MMPNGLDYCCFGLLSLKISNNMNVISLTNKEKTDLVLLSEKLHPHYQRGFQEIAYLERFPDFNIRQWVKTFGKDRNVQFRRMHDPEIAVFSSVNMHTDQLYGKHYVTLLIPIKGKGELSHFVPFCERKKQITQTDFCFGQAYILDDSQPHSFMTKNKNVYAIMVNISRKCAKKLFVEDEI